MLFRSDAGAPRDLAGIQNAQSISTGASGAGPASQSAIAAPTAGSGLNAGATASMSGSTTPDSWIPTQSKIMQGVDSRINPLAKPIYRGNEPLQTKSREAGASSAYSSGPDMGATSTNVTGPSAGDREFMKSLGDMRKYMRKR